MDNKQEYQDPDYAGASVTKKPVQVLSEVEQLEKIRNIIRREFGNEIEARENEVTMADQRLLKARRILQRLRYALVNNYYKQERLQLSSGQLQDDLEAMAQVQAKPELSTLLREGQRRIHPSVRKLLGKDTVNLEEIFKCREPRNKTKKNYQTLFKSKNVTTPEDATKSLRPMTSQVEVPEPDPGTSKPKKIPRQIDPKVLNVLNIDEATRNKTKHRYRIIIGNTSKYAPPASRADRSTHKWLLYIRGPPQRPDLSRVLTHATVRLHHSYAPHHTVHLHKPPFHVSRRGWGEFPAKIELHFALPSRNRPATVEHTIKLDRNYTGLQTLGAETIVDVWLHSTEEMLEYEFIEPEQDPTQQPADTHTDTNTDTQTYPQVEVKQEVIETEAMSEMENHSESWMEFFSKNTTEVNVDEMLVKTHKNIEQDEPNANAKTDVESQQIKNEPVDDTDFLKVPNEILNQPAIDKKRIVKYIEPNTGKIYYLEMDRTLDLSKVQEIIIESEDGVKTAKISPMKSNGLRNVRKPKKMESLLKPELKELINSKKEKQNKVNEFDYIRNDHCYVNMDYEENHKIKEEIPPEYGECENEVIEDGDRDGEIDETDPLSKIQEAVFKLTNVKMVVDYMLKKIVIISEEAAKPNYLKYFPFVVQNEERYWKLDFAKRRNIEWSRAKLINKMLRVRFGSDEKIWRTKQILIYSRLHGYNPIRTEIYRQTETRNDEWSSWNDLETRTAETNIKEIYPNASDICTLTVFDSNEYLPYMNSELVDLTDCEDEIDVVGTKSEVKKVLPVTKDVSSLTVLPVESDEDRLRFMYIERKCADIGIELRNEDVGNGCSYSAVHAVMLSAVKSFAEELIRSALAANLSERRKLEYLPSVWVGSSSRTSISVEHVYAGTNASRLHVLSARSLATENQHTTTPL